MTQNSLHQKSLTEGTTITILSGVLVYGTPSFRDSTMEPLKSIVLIFGCVIVINDLVLNHFGVPPSRVDLRDFFPY